MDSSIDPLPPVVFFFIIVILLIIIFVWLYHKSIFAPSRKIADHNISKENRPYHSYFIGCRSGKALEDKKNKGENNINVRLYHNYPGEKVMLFFHGNSGNISHRSYVVQICEKFGLNLLLVDYEGYGLSDGEPGIKKILDTSDLAYKFLCKTFQPHDIIAWGESMGGSAAVWVASRFKLRSLVLLSTFTSITDIAKTTRGGSAIAGLINLSGKDWKSDVWAKEVKCPTLIIHSSEDTLIPYKLAQKLYRCIGSRHKKMVTIKGDHPAPQIKESQFDEVFAFLGIKKHQHNMDKIAKTIENVAKEENWV